MKSGFARLRCGKAPGAPFPPAAWAWGAGSGRSLRGPLDKFVQQSFGLVPHGEDGRADLVKRAQRLRLVEVAGKRFAVAQVGVPPGDNPGKLRRVLFRSPSASFRTARMAARISSSVRSGFGW